MTDCVACGHSLREFDSADLRKKVQKRHAAFWDAAGGSPGTLDVIRAWIGVGVIRSPETHCIACGCPFRLGPGSALTRRERHGAFWAETDLGAAKLRTLGPAPREGIDRDILEALCAWVAEGAPETPGCYLIRGQVRVNVSGLRALGLGATATTKRLGMALRRISGRQVTTRLPSGRTPKLWIVEL